MSEGVKASDVWESGAGRKAKVKEVSSSGRCKIVLLATKVEQTVWTASFVKGRKLVERDGKPFAGYESALKASDVWESGAGRRARVTTVRTEGWCSVTLLATGAQRTMAIGSFVRNRKLIERDGKAVSA